MNTGYISQGRTPCQGVDYLEGNSGKGLDLSAALYSLVGESVERFAAWQSNKMIGKLDVTEAIHKKNIPIYDVDQFHPFGPKWTHYLSTEKIKLPLYQVQDEIQPHRLCSVPECLIPFPYEAPGSQYEVSSASTAGLAVHSDRTRAIIKGSLELFERNDFYPAFLMQQLGYVLDFSELGSSAKHGAGLTQALNSQMHDFLVLLEHLQEHQLRYWCIVYDLQSSLPLVHCFIEDQKNHFMSRGTGSGYTLLEAVSGAIAEALQIRQQFLNEDTEAISKGYIDWRKPVVMQKIQEYLAAFQMLPFVAHPLSGIEYTSDLLLSEIKKSLVQLGKPLLVAELPCAIIGWFAVRVLIPGFTTHQYPSDSLGGQKIIDPVFEYGVPS